MPRGGDAFNLLTVCGGGDRERVQATINPDPAAAVRGLRLVVARGVQVSGLNIPTHPPAATPPRNGREQNLAPAFGDQATQVTGVVVDAHLTDTGKRDRASDLAVTDADRRLATFGVLVTQPERVHAFAFTFHSRETDLAAFAVAFLRRG